MVAGFFNTKAVECIYTGRPAGTTDVGVPLFSQKKPVLKKTMSTQNTGDPVSTPPPYIIPMDEKGDNVKVYHPHTPFTPPQSAADANPYSNQRPNTSQVASKPVNKFVSHETDIGRYSTMTTCISCRQQVMTNVTYRVGAYAWLMCILFILCGLVVGCCLIPFFVKHFKDAYHSCPRCNQILHVEKKRCC